MISTLTGSISHTNLDRIVVEISGVGFEVALTMRHALKLKVGDKLTVFTRLIVREDDLSLYGFESSSERELFDQLCSVSGIGPKLALTTLSGLDASSLRSAIIEQNELVFKAIPGIGPKTAKLIILSLSGKVGVAERSHYPNVQAALAQLGTNDSQAQKALAAIEPGLSDSQALKAALAALSAGKF